MRFKSKPKNYTCDNCSREQYTNDICYGCKGTDFSPIRNVRSEQIKPLSEIFPPKKLEEIITQMTQEFRRYIEFHDECIIQYKDEVKSLQDELMADGVVAGESYVEIAKSEDDFDDYIIIEKVVAVRDDVRMKISTPKDEGYDWDYWAKWENV